MLSEDDIRRTAGGIADTLASIDAGALDATQSQRAFLAGSLDALRLVLDEVEVRDFSGAAP